MSRSVTPRQLRERIARAVDERQVDPCLDEFYDDGRTCDGQNCDLCNPGFYEEQAIQRRMAVEVPKFSVADRVLAQAGILIVLAA
jgi:hypothetical protein